MSKMGEMHIVYIFLTNKMNEVNKFLPIVYLSLILRPGLVKIEKIPKNDTKAYVE